MDHLLPRPVGVVFLQLWSVCPSMIRLNFSTTNLEENKTARNAKSRCEKDRFGEDVDDQPATWTTMLGLKVPGFIPAGRYTRTIHVVVDFCLRGSQAMWLALCTTSNSDPLLEPPLFLWGSTNQSDNFYCQLNKHPTTRHGKRHGSFFLCERW